MLAVSPAKNGLVRLAFLRLLGCSARDDLSAALIGFGADVVEVVGFVEDIGVVFDDDGGVAFIDEAMEEVGEARDVGTCAKRRERLRIERAEFVC